MLLLTVALTGCDKGLSNEITEQQFKKYLKKKYFEIANSEHQVTDFDYQLINGSEGKLLEDKGKIILLNFWAVWCFPCKKEMPDLEELKHKMKGEKFRILAVNSGDKEQKIRSFLKKYPYSFDIIVDEDRKISSSLNIKGLPTTFILNGNMQVVGKIIGPIDWKDETFIEYLTKYSRT